MSNNNNKIEQRRLSLQANLDSLKTQEERNRLGQFATPTRLARDIVAYSLTLLPKSTPLRFLDCAIGTGGLYSALLSTSAGRIVQSATGVEIDPHYAKPAKKLWSNTPLKIIQADFTHLAPPVDERKRATLLIGNPPYVRHQWLPRSEKERLHTASKTAAGIELSRQCGLYCHFVALGQPHLSEGGIGVWLIPSEFMDVNYGRALKAYLLRQVTLVRIHRFDPIDQQFDDALVSSAVVWIRKEKPRGDYRVEFSYGGTVKKPTMCKAVSAEALAGTDKWTRFPRRGVEAKHYGYRLDDLFTIKRGLLTGANDFFIIDEQKAENLKLPRRYLRSILPKPLYIKCDEIKSDGAGLPLLGEKRLFLVDCDRSEEELEREEPALWAYLQTGVTTFAHGYVCRTKRKDWYAQEQRPAAPILCTTAGRGARPFRFLLNNSIATATNTYLMLYPKPILGKRFMLGTEALRPIWKALNAISRDALIDNGRVYGGGLHKIEPRELANVPVDDIAELAGLPRKTPHGP